MAFDFSNMMASPSFQMGLGLLGAARPRNRPLLDAYQIINQMQQQQLEQQKMKQYLELQQAQEKRLEEQSKLYARQVATAEEKAKREAAMGKLFEQMLPGLMGGQQPLAAPQMPAPPQPAQPTMPEMEPLAPSSQFFRSRLVPIESGGKQFGEDGRPVTSPKGAVGIAQVMPTTGPEAAKLAGVPWDVRRFHQDEGYNLQLGEAYFQKQLQDFKSLDKAAAAYNAGPGRLKEAIARATLAGNPATWLNYMPQETQAYVNKALEGKTGLATPTLPNEAPQQPGVPVVDNRYRDLQRASAAFKGMGGDYAGALEGFAGAMKPEVRKPGDIIIGPDGRQHQIPDPLGERRVAADEAGVNIRQQTEQRQAQVAQREASGQLAKDRAAYTTVTAATGGIKTKVDELLSDPGLEGLEGLWGAVGQIPGSVAYDTRQNLESLKSEIANTLLQAVRNASANGASGYGQFTEKELGVIQSMVAPIKPGMTDKALRASLMKIRNYMDTLEGQATKLYEDAHGKSPIEGLPAGARQIGTSGGKPVYETPDGKRWVGQ